MTNKTSGKALNLALIVTTLIDGGLVGGVINKSRQSTRKTPIETETAVTRQADYRDKQVQVETKTEQVYNADKRTDESAKKPSLLLVRTEFTDKSIIGELYGDRNRNGTIDKGEELLAHTLELPYRDNKRNMSSIPYGNYSVAIRTSPKFGNHFIVENVKGRSHILFHPGNSAKDTAGCILVGKTKAKNYIGDSRTAMKGLRAKFPNGFNLRIRNSTH